MRTLLMTGFPGFLGSALLPRLLARPGAGHVVCLVQDRHLGTARQRLAELERQHPQLRDHVDLVVGDLTEGGLGLSGADRTRVERAEEVWHLAAVYDLSVPEEVARRVNVTGTARVLELCRDGDRPRRLHYASTCYVSGSHDGEFTEDDLDVGQRFRNHYESTKFEAEVLVRKAVADGLPATVYRPGIVVGDSRTGATQKYDGPYFLATFLRRQPLVALVPHVAPPDHVKFWLVPRDFVVDAMDRLSTLEASIGRTYALTDPEPPTIRELVDTFAKALHRRVVWVPLPLGPTRLAIDRVPGVERLLGLPSEALDYLAAPTAYSTEHTVADLSGTGLTCPRFTDYADRLLDFMAGHPEIDSRAMV